MNENQSFAQRHAQAIAGLLWRGPVSTLATVDGDEIGNDPGKSESLVSA